MPPPPAHRQPPPAAASRKIGTLADIPGLPTPNEARATLLHDVQHLCDFEIAELLDVSRETVCRRRSNYRRKMELLRLALPQVYAELVERPSMLLAAA